MQDQLENEFAAIAEEAIDKSEEIACSLEEYRTGLMIMEAVIRERINGVKEELDALGLREEL